MKEKKVKKVKKVKTEKENKKSKKEKVKTSKTQKSNKFIEVIKKKWLINSSKTILLVMIILGFFIGVTIFNQ